MGMDAEVHPRAIVSVWPREWVEEIEDGVFVPIEALVPPEEQPGRNEEVPPDEEPHQPGDEHPPLARPLQQNDWSPPDENPSSQNHSFHSEEIPSPQNRFIIQVDNSPDNEWSHSEEESLHEWFRQNGHPSPQNQWHNQGEDPSPQDQLPSPDGPSLQIQSPCPDERPSPQNHWPQSNGDQSHQHNGSHPNAAARGTERSRSQQRALSEVHFELFDSFVRFPPTNAEFAAIEEEQGLRRKLNLTVLPLEENTDHDDDVVYTGVNTTRELEEYGFEFEEREEFPDTDESFTSSNDEANGIVEILRELRTRWCRTRNENHHIEHARTDAEENSTETVSDDSNTTPLDLSVSRLVEEEQRSGGYPETSGWPQSPRRPQEAPLWRPSPKRLRLLGGGFSTASVEPASVVASSGVGRLQPATDGGVTTSHTAGNSPQAAEVDGYSSNLHDHRSETPPAQSHTPPSADDDVVAIDLTGRKTGLIWSDLLASERPSSSARTRAETDSGTAPLDLSVTRSGDEDDDEIVEIGGTRGDGHQENDASASALLDGDETTFFSISGDPYPEMSRTLAQTQGRDPFSCHQFFLPFSCLIAWIVTTSCLVAGQYIAAAIAFAIFFILLACTACQKYALPALRRRWQRVSVASGALRETAVVQHPMRLSELSELYP